MGKNKNYFIIIGCLFIFALVSPVIIAWLALVLSPYISTIGVIIIIFIVTVMIAWRGKIGRN
ncbi:MAG: hypothetical protein JJE18_08905 [Eubacteriaceae bacterium]|nr:hypothetical protein [Eubacteriaceae bacterium]